MTTLLSLGAAYLETLSEGACETRKRRFVTIQAAAAARDLAQLRSDVEPWRQEHHAYWCDRCDGWHLTAQAR